MFPRCNSLRARRVKLFTQFTLALCLGANTGANTAHACLWDSDTLQQERSRFPSTLELIVGNFLRHSPEFYRWRVQQRQAALAAGDRRPEHYDDLGVAQDKLGNSLSAIDWMNRKEDLFPGRYETYANLGTFHIHAGNLKTGAEWIRKALELNPDAHFGREKHQLLLVEFLLEGSPDAKEDTSGIAPMGFARFLAQRKASQQTPAGEPSAEALASPPEWLPLDEEESQAAIQGIQGMMRFGHYDSPVLLEALGDLLAEPQDQQRDACLLAARAYLRAAEKSEQRREVLKKKAASVLEMHEGIELSTVQSELALEVEQAKQWFEGLAEQEKQWIADPNLDPEIEFNKLYEPPFDVDPAPQGGQGKAPPSAIATKMRALIVAFVVLLVGVGVVVVKSVQANVQAPAK